MPSNLDIIKAGLAGVQTNKRLRSYFLREYSKVFGEACATCGNKLPEYYTRYINYINTMGEYVLKPSKSGMVNVIPFENDWVTNANVNNKVKGHALGTRMLAASESFMKYFEKYPDNYKELVAAFRGQKVVEEIEEVAEVTSEPKAVPSIDELTKNEIMAFLDAKGVKYDKMKKKADLYDLLTA